MRRHISDNVLCENGKFHVISGLKLKAAPAPALQARRHAAGFARNTSTVDRHGRLPDILISAAKTNFISHRKNIRHKLSGASKIRAGSYNVNNNQSSVLSTDCRSDRNNKCCVLQSSHRDNSITVAKPSRCFSGNNSSQKPEYFIDNNNQIHERQRMQKLNRKPRISEIIGPKKEVGSNTKMKGESEDTGQYEPVAPSSKSSTTKVSRPRSNVETKQR